MVYNTSEFGKSLGARNDLKYDFVAIFSSSCNIFVEVYVKDPYKSSDA